MEVLHGLVQGGTRGAPAPWSKWDEQQGSEDDELMMSSRAPRGPFQKQKATIWDM